MFAVQKQNPHTYCNEISKINFPKIEVLENEHRIYPIIKKHLQDSDRLSTARSESCRLAV